MSRIAKYAIFFLGVCPPVFAGDIEDREALRVEVEQLRASGRLNIRGIDVASKSLLAEIYERREYSLAWSDTKPVSARLSLGIGAMYVDDMVSDDKRTMTLRLDDMWMLGVGAEWQWTETRSLFAMLNYLQMGDAPVRTDSIGGIGIAMGRYKDRGSILLQIGMKLGAGPGRRPLDYLFRRL